MAWGYGAWVVLEVSEVHVLPVPGPSVFLQAPWSRSWVVGCVRVAMDTSLCRESLLAACPTPYGTYPPSSSMGDEFNPILLLLYSNFNTIIIYILLLFYFD